MTLGRPGRELFVISDIHLGGIAAKPGSNDERGFRLCTQAAALARFIGLVAARRADEPIELVINGDFVDFLAQPDLRDGHPRWRAFIADPDDALSELQRIAHEHPQVFDSLADVIRAGHHVTLMLGNHDVELSFPLLRQWLHQRLADAGEQRLRFIHDGEAYTVGTLLIEHGNRYDGFNVTDHDGLRRHRSLQSRRQALDSVRGFEVPPGSLLVAELMNPLKEQRYAFVDLLKPEVAAVIPLLLVLAPGLVAKASRVAALKWHASRRSPGKPAQPRQDGDANAATDATAEQRGVDPLGALLDEVLGPEDRRLFMQALAERGPRDGDASAADRPMSVKAAHLALRRLQRDRSFDRGHEGDAPYLEAAQALSRQGFDCIAFGHTHLAKQVPLGAGACYLNSGTWADLIRLPEDCTDADTAVAYPAIENLLARLKANDLEGLIETMPTYLHVRVASTGAVTHARLRDFVDGQTSLD